MRPARLLGVMLLLGGSCASTAPPTVESIWPPADPLSVRYRDRQSRQRAAGATAATGATGDAPVAAVWSYRTLVAPALGSRCRMVPSDSEYVDRRARGCGGGVSAAVLGISRVLLEVGASPALLPATVQGGRLHFVDLPPAPGHCRP